MVRKTQKNLNLPIPVVERLEEEENQSATVTEALCDLWDDPPEVANGVD